MALPEVGFVFQCDGQPWIVSEPTWDRVVIAKNANGTIGAFIEQNGVWVRSEMPHRKLGD